MRHISVRKKEGEVCMKIVSINNQKGGVGKTTLSFNLIKGLAAAGYRTLAIDNDPQGNLTSCFLENELSLTANVMDIYSGQIVKPHNISEGLDLIGADINLARVAEQDFEIIFKLKEGIVPLIKNYDFAIIDCLPSLGYLSTAALNASDLVLIPTKPTQFGLSGMTDLLSIIEKTKSRLNGNLNLLGIVLNLVENTVICKEFQAVLRKAYGEKVFETEINKSVKIEESPTVNQSIVEYEPQSKSAAQFKAFTAEFINKVKDAGNGRK